MKILAATDFSTRSQRAVRRAGCLTRAANARLGVLHVVDDDQPEGMVALEQNESRRIIEEQIASVPELQGIPAEPIVTAADPFDGILKTAARFEADLIVMGSHRRDLLREVFLGTTVERVTRVAPCPVLMVNSDTEAPYRNALVAMESNEDATRALCAVRSLKVVAANEEITLIHGFNPLGKGQMTFAGLAHETIRDYSGKQALVLSGDLTKSLEEVASQYQPWFLRLQEGNALTAIVREVEALQPDILAIGSRGRSAIGRLLLGSVTEEVMRTLRIDILVIPPGEYRPN